MVLFFSLDANFETCTSIRAKIAKIDVIIDSLYTTMALVAGTANHASYKIDDGQSVQEVFYTSASSIQKAIDAFENQRQRQVNKLIGNSVRNIGSKNLNRRC